MATKVECTCGNGTFTRTKRVKKRRRKVFGHGERSSIPKGIV